MYQTKPPAFYADVAALATAVIILITFLSLPFIGGIPALAILTLGSGVSGGADSGVWLFMLIFIPLAALAAGISAAVSLGASHLSRTLSWVSLAAGAVMLLVLLLLLAQMANAIGLFGSALSPAGTPAGTGFSFALTLTSIGYWLIFFGALTLIGLVFVSRDIPALAPNPVQFVAVPPPPMSAPPQPAPLPPLPAAPQSRPRRQPLANAWLVPVYDGSETYQLNRGETRIGRARARNDIILNSPRVSREHCLIREYENNQFVIFEIAARQPIYVNSRPISSKQVLHQDDLIMLGDVTLRFVRG